MIGKRKTSHRLSTASWGGLATAALAVPIGACSASISDPVSTPAPVERVATVQEQLTVGTWTAIPSNFLSNGANSVALLTDGSLLVNSDIDWHVWSRYYPDASGSYVNGTWKQAASSFRGRLYYPEAILRDGRVFVGGGEYIQDSDDNTNATEVYDPVADIWSPGPAGLFGDIGDVPSAVLTDGRVIVGYRGGTQTQIYNPATNTFTQSGSLVPSAGGSSEAGWQLLADGTVFDFIRTAERYLPSSNTWIAAAAAPVALSTDFELGPYQYLQDGRVFVVSDNTVTAYFTPPTTLTGTGSWTVGPSLPSGVGADTPSAIEPNGKVLLEGTAGVFGPATLFELDPTTNTYASVQFPSIPPTCMECTPAAGFTTRMLVLPNGQILFVAGGQGFYVYTPASGPQPSWAPTISAVTANPDGSFTVTGTQLNGNSYGSTYGDDHENASNYPIVYLTDSANHVWYARTYNFSTMGLRTGAAAESAQFTVPGNLPVGTYSLQVSAVGISSQPVSFTYTVGSVNGTCTIRTVAGNGVAGSGGDGGPATSAQLTQSFGVGADPLGGLYIADQYNSRVRTVSAAGTIAAFAGTGSYGLSGDGGRATAAQLRQPWMVKADGSGNVYILDPQANNVRKVDPTGTITTVAGSATGAAGSSGDGGPATSALLRQPTGLALDTLGDLYIVDSGNAAIRMVNTSGVIFTIVGAVGTPGFADATLNTPSLINPSSSTLAGIVVDSSTAPEGTPTVYFNDTNNFRVRKAFRGSSGKFYVTSTVAGTGSPGNGGDGGPATAATVTQLQGLALDSRGNVVLSDSSAQRIRRVDLSSGVISALAGTGAGGFSGDNGPASRAAFNSPEDLSTDARGGLLIMDKANIRVRRIDACGP
jgi:NHL repeat